MIKKAKLFQMAHALILIFALIAMFNISHVFAESHLIEAGCEDGYLIALSGKNKSCEESFLALLDSGKKEDSIALIFNLIDNLFDHGYVDAVDQFLDLVQSTHLIEDLEVQFIWYRFKRKQHLYQGDYNRALNYANKSLKMAMDKNIATWKAKSFNDIGIVYKGMGEYKKAIEFYIKSLEIKEKIGLKLPIAYTVNNIGNLYRDLEDPESALSFYRRTIKLYLSIKDKDMSSKVADVYENIGLVLGQVGNLSAGYDALSNSIKMYKLLEQKNDLIRALIILADLKNMGGYFRDANDLLIEAEALEGKLEVKPYLRLRVAKAKSLLGLKDYFKAKTYALKALAMSESYGDDLNQVAALYLLYEIQKSLGDSSAALSYLEKYTDDKDIINKKIMDDQLVRLQSEIRFKESEKELESLDKDYQIQQLKVIEQGFYLLVLASVLFIFVLVFWLINKAKKTENNKLKMVIEEHEEKYRLLGQSQSQIEKIFSTSNEPIICFDVAGYVLFMNEPFAQLYQTTSAAFIGQTVDVCLPGLVKYFQVISAEDEGVETKCFVETELAINSKLLVCDLSVYLLNSVDDYIIISINGQSSKKEVVNMDSTLRNLSKFQEFSAKLKKISNSISSNQVLESQGLIKQMDSLEQQLMELFHQPNESDQKQEIRVELVNLMCLCISTWEISTQSDKNSLAEKSKIWRVSIDNGSIRTRSMDRYLNITSLPQRPRWRYVVRTAHYILANCQLDELQRDHLTQQLDKFSGLMRWTS